MKLTAEPIIEPVPIDDIFCTVTAQIDRVGPCHRVTFCTPAPVLDGEENALAVVAKPMLTEEALMALLDAIPQYLAGLRQERREDRIGARLLQ